MKDQIIGVLLLGALGLAIVYAIRLRVRARRYRAAFVAELEGQFGGRLVRVGNLRYTTRLESGREVSISFFFNREPEGPQPFVTFVLKVSSELLARIELGPGALRFDADTRALVERSPALGDTIAAGFHELGILGVNVARGQLTAFARVATLGAARFPRAVALLDEIAAALENNEPA
jgi:hypothetical protein